eukprot:jgi/Picsp_1/2464/NSC_05925-R1_magnesium transporter
MTSNLRESKEDEKQQNGTDVLHCGRLFLGPESGIHSWTSILSKNCWSSSLHNKSTQSLTLEHSSKWIHIDANGTAKYIRFTRHSMVEILQLRYRDLVVVDPTLPVPVASVIFIRPKALVVNLDVGGSFRMIICENQCFILGLPGLSDTSQTTLPILDHPFVVSLSECLRKASQNIFEDALGMPYELIALETALNAAVGILSRDIEDFESKAIDQIEAMLRRVDRDTLEGIRKVKNHVDWLQSKVSKLQQEINEILEDDYDMLDMYLGRRSLTSGANPLRQPNKDDFDDAECESNENLSSQSKAENSKSEITGRRNKPRALKGVMMLGPRVPRRSRKAANRRNRKRMYVDVDALFKQRRRNIRKMREDRGEPLDATQLTDADSDAALTEAEEEMVQEESSATKRHNHDRVDPHEIEEAEDLLESTFVNLDLLLRRLVALDEKIDDAEDFLELDLDQRRNELVALNLLVASVAMSFGFAAVIAGIFGMNLVNSDLVDEAWVLPVVLVVTFALSVLILLSVIWYVRRRKLMFIPNAI